MFFVETKLKGSFVIELEKLEDERGFFARTWDKKKFEEHGLNSELAQCSTSYTKKKGTIRGMHYQAFPHQEVKLVSCTKGKVFDLTIDVRPKSPTFMKWFGIELSEDNYKAIYVPEGVAHGIETLEDDTVLFYQTSQFHSPESERGVRWDDPAFNITWPIPPIIISKKDRTHPDFQY